MLIGKNCEIDIQECESSPCQYVGVCLERSNASLYQNTSYDPLNPVYVNKELNMLLPMHFFQEFSYENASGYVPNTMYHTYNSYWIQIIIIIFT